MEVEIINKYLEGKASDDEIKQVDDWYHSFDSNPELCLPDALELNRAMVKGFSELRLKFAL